MKDPCQLHPLIRLVRMIRHACRCRRAGRGNLPLSAPVRRRWTGRTAGLFGLMVYLGGGLAAHSEISMSEYRVKALFLCNFVKYVDWPAAGATGPVVIGVLGKDNFNGDLARAVEGKSVNGRAITIKRLSAGDDPSGCSILFVSASESSQFGEILNKTGALPILTVGEDGSFLQKGGIINFALKEGKIRLEINLKASRRANLQISSKLLSLADVVKE